MASDANRRMRELFELLDRARWEGDSEEFNVSIGVRRWGRDQCCFLYELTVEETADSHTIFTGRGDSLEAATIDALSKAQDELRRARRSRRGCVPANQEPEEPGYMLVTDGAAKRWWLDGLVTDWRDAINFPPLPFSGPLRSARFEMEIDTGNGPTKGGPQSFVYLRRDRDRWAKGGSGDCILLVDRSDNGALVLSTTLSGQVVSKPVKWLMPQRQRVRLEVIVDATLHAWASVSETVSHELICESELGLPTPIDVRDRLLLQLGQDATNPQHPSNRSMRLLRFSGEVA